MNCDGAQELLCEFLDKRLDASTARLVEEHLASCANCHADADDLADTIQLAKSEPPVEPPMAFATRVMAHVQEQTTQPSFWQRILHAFRTAMPVQAMAVAVVAVPSVFIYQKQPKVEPTQPVAKPEVTSPAPGDTAQNQGKESADQPILELSPPRSPTALEKARTASEMQPRSQGQGFAQQPQTAAPASEPAADYEVTIRLSSPARSAKAEVATRDNALPESNLDTLYRAKQQAMDTGQPQTVSLNVAASAIPDLKKTLSAIGVVDSGTALDQISENSPKPLRIKITLLPPLPGSK